MPNIKHQIHVVTEQIGDDLVLIRGLLYPETSTLRFDAAIQEANHHFADSAEVDEQNLSLAGLSTDDKFVKYLVDLSEETAAADFYKRVIPSNPDSRTIQVQLKSPEKVSNELCWQADINLPVHYIAWNHAEDAAIAYIPSFDIMVVRRGCLNENFAGQVRLEIRNALIRNESLTKFRELVTLSNHGPLRLTQHTVDVGLPTPKEAEQNSSQATDKEATLRQVGWRIDSYTRTSSLANQDRIHRQQTHPAFEMDEQIGLFVELLRATERKSVLLIGPAGVGKSALLQQVAVDKKQHGLLETEFWETGGSRIVAGMSGFGQWQERCQMLIAEIKKKDAILHLGNLIELLDVGKSASQSEGIASYLRSFIQRGEVWATAECTAEQLAVIEKQDPQLLNTFHHFRIAAPADARAVRILSKCAQHFGAPGNIVLDAAAIETTLRLHRRYATYSSMPGRPIRFLRNLINDADDSGLLNSEDVIREFAEETGLPYFLLSEEQSLDLSETEHWFSQHVIGQCQPVDRIVNMLATIKASLTPAGRPIASFLFIGPTGVGKTEMAKSLAEFMYSDSTKMIRFDMSEYQDQTAVQRLIGGHGLTEGVLTSKVRQNPFSVVLFDEFEKAHQSFFDLLLQIMGEGRLTDSRGRVSDFSTAIIILTSNLGVQSFRSTATGFAAASDQQQHYQSHFVDQVKKFMRPELFNRIDCVVPFEPLSKETVRAVVEREIGKLQQREGIKYRGVDLRLDDDSVDLISERARDSRYGARPLQRFIQQQVAVKLADKLNQYSTTNRIRSHVRVNNDRLEFEIKAQEKGTGDGVAANLSAAVKELQYQRGRAQQLFHSATANRVRNELYRLKENRKRYEKRYVKKHGSRDGLNPWELDNEIARFHSMVESIETNYHASCKIEDDQLMRIFDQLPVAEKEVETAAGTIEKETYQSLLKLFVFDTKGSDKITLFVFSRDEDIIRKLTQGYKLASDERDFKTTYYFLKRIKNRIPYTQPPGATCSLKLGPDSDEDEVTRKYPYANVFRVNFTDVMLDFPKDLLGVAMEISGDAAFPIFSYERAIHLFKTGNVKRRALVESSGGPMNLFELPPEVATLGPFDQNLRQRIYDFDDGTIAQPDVKKIKAQISNEQLPEAIRNCIAWMLSAYLERYFS